MLDDEEGVAGDAPPPAILATGIHMDGPWGPVYGPVDLTVPTGGVTVLLCPSGSGRTALLLTLTGRMAPRKGSLTVLGENRVNKIFTMSALAGVDEIDTVSESVTVRDLITEQVRWRTPWFRRVRPTDGVALQRVCGPVFGSRPLPDLTGYVDELDQLDGLLLRIALANISRPPLLAVGNLDHLGSENDRAFLIDRLVELGRVQTIVTASVDPLDNTEVLAQIAVPNAHHAPTRLKGL